MPETIDMTTDVVYYYIIYLTDNTIHLKPFLYKEDADEYKKKADEHFKDRLKFSKITRKDLAKAFERNKNEFWL